MRSRAAIAVLSMGISLSFAGCSNAVVSPLPVEPSASASSSSIPSQTPSQTPSQDTLDPSIYASYPNSDKWPTSNPKTISSGAVGNFATEVLSADRANDLKDVVSDFTIVEGSKEEIAQNIQDAYVGLMMSGTSDFDYSLYADENGEVAPEGQKVFIDESSKYYDDAACRGLVISGVDCSSPFGEDAQEMHRLILFLYANNRSATGKPVAPDFTLGSGKVSNVKITDGSIGEGKFTIQYDVKLSNNFFGSSAENAVKRFVKENDTESLNKIVSLRNWGGTLRATINLWSEYNGSQNLYQMTIWKNKYTTIW